MDSIRERVDRPMTWACTKWFDRRHELRAGEGESLVASLDVEPQFAATPELPLLICLGQYMRILAQRSRVG